MTEPRTITESELNEAIEAAPSSMDYERVLLATFGITVVPDPAPPLPTEPGVYMSSLLGIPLWLMDDGRWWTSRTQVHDPARHMPLERLETRAEVLAEVERRAIAAAREAGDYDGASPGWPMVYRIFDEMLGRGHTR